MEKTMQQNVQRLSHLPPPFDECETAGGQRRGAAIAGVGSVSSSSSSFSQHVSTMLSHRLWRGMDLSMSRPRIGFVPSGRRRMRTAALDGCGGLEVAATGGWCDDRSYYSSFLGGRNNKRRRVGRMCYAAAAACILLGTLCPAVPVVRSFVPPPSLPVGRVPFGERAKAMGGASGPLSMSAVMAPPPLTGRDVVSTTGRRRDARSAPRIKDAGVVAREAETLRSRSRPPSASRAAAVSEASVRVARKAAAIAAASSAKAKRSARGPTSTATVMARPIVLERTYEDNARRRAAATAASASASATNAVDTVATATATATAPPKAAVTSPRRRERATARARASGRISSKPRVLRRRRAQHTSSTMPGFSDGASTESGSRATGSKRRNAERMYRDGAGVPDSLSVFVREIHRDTKLLTAEEEVVLGTRIQDAIRIQDVFDDLSAELGREPTDDEWTSASGLRSVEELEEAVEAGRTAKKELVMANLRMVQRVVNLYLRNGLGSQYNAGDLMQEGTMALIRAAEKYEPKRGFRFSTYAMYWIRASVKRSQVLQSSPINVPQRLYETYKKVQRTSAELREMNGGRKPTSSELAEAVGLSEVQLHRCTRAMEQRCYSLDAELNNRSGKPGEAQSKSHTMYDLVESKEDDREEFRVERLFVRDDLIESMRRHLSPERVDLLLLRFGLMDERTLPHGFSGPLTISEVSRLVGIKPDKVRRLINNSLRQLKSLIAHEWEP